MKRYVRANTNAEDVKAYVIELIDSGEGVNLIFNVGGRFPDLTIRDFTPIVTELFNEGYEIPGIEY
jgi:hypothetical protein